VLGVGRDFARQLRQRIGQSKPAQPEHAGEVRRQRAAIVVKVVERVGDALLIVVKSGTGAEGGVDVQQHIVGCVAQAGVETGRQILRGER